MGQAPVLLMILSCKQPIVYAISQLTKGCDDQLPESLLQSHLSQHPTQVEPLGRAHTSSHTSFSRAWLAINVRVMPNVVN